MWFEEERKPRQAGYQINRVVNTSAIDSLSRFDKKKNIETPKQREYTKKKKKLKNNLEKEKKQKQNVVFQI